MEGLLTQVSQSYRKPVEEPQFLRSSEPIKRTIEPIVEFKGSSAEEALNVLKKQPGYDALLSVLIYLRKGVQGKHSFDIRKPSPQAAQLVHVLSTEIIPNYWTLLTEGSSDQKRGDVDILLACLQSIPGVNGLLTYLRALLRETKADPKGLKQSHTIFNISFILDVLSRLLKPDDALKRIWDSVHSLQISTQIRPLRQEFLALFTSGKIISLSAEAEETLRQADKLQDVTWTADGKSYIDWLGRNLTGWITPTMSDVDRKLCADLTARATRLAHSDRLAKQLFVDLLINDTANSNMFSQFFSHLPSLEQRKMLLVILKLLAETHLSSMDVSDTAEDYPVIWAAANALKRVIGDDEIRQSHLLGWLTGTPGAGIGEGCGIRRAAIAALADDREAITTVLEKSMNLFGDQLYIKHTPMLQQEAHAQVLLLSAGYVHRLAPIKLTLLTRSSTYLNAISSRIAASQVRARFLGMAVGEALSELVHSKDKKLSFKIEEMDTDEANWYKSLVNTSDKLGPLDPLRQPHSSRPLEKTKATGPKAKALPQSARAAAPRPGFIIEEVEDDDEDEDPDLVPYAKPDSDAEDSDDDPTLINRDKPRAPVYIRELIAYLRDTESYDKQKLALTTAPTLIRRKADFGTEVSSHVEELATLLVGLQDKYDLDNFHDLRLQGMIAVVVAQPKKMGQWFAKTFFDGDYSLSQRASILIVLGLSARELAGFDVSEYAAAASFPSKRLPEKIEKHYALPPAPAGYGSSSASKLKGLPPNAIDSIAQSLSQAFLAPLAAEAADAATGPDALKLSSFTSRLQQQQQQSQSLSSPSSNSLKTASAARPNKKKPGIRAIPNTTASLLSTSFFFPLTSRFQAAMRSTRGGGSGGILFQPDLLALYLQTLGLLLHAAGPSTLALPQMTAELWDLVLGARGPSLVRSSSPSGAEAGAETGVVRALLFALVALLDVNEGDVRGLCERHGREVVETTEWVAAVFNDTRGGDAGGAGEESEVKMLAAGVLIRLREAVEKHQAVLMGDLIGFT
ncbi:telomere binding protein [Diatrype stigma]|uniref:Telomere binding protein n=1 Tax=Diatrype stigma TaxID=117547 RepID=A0AAN9UCF4_9PEZI